MRTLSSVLASVCAATLALASAPAMAQSYDLELSDIQGVWNNDATGENVTINGRMVQDSSMGQGRIGVAEDYGANFRVTYQGNVKCYYLITMTSRTRINFAVRNKNQSRVSCLHGPFNREY